MKFLESQRNADIKKRKKSKAANRKQKPKSRGSEKSSVKDKKNTKKGENLVDTDDIDVDF